MKVYELRGFARACRKLAREAADPAEREALFAEAERYEQEARDLDRGRK